MNKMDEMDATDRLVHPSILSTPSMPSMPSLAEGRPVVLLNIYIF
jgi:hypothetical protein